MVRREWFSSEELAALALPDVPTESKNVRLLAQRRGWQEQGREGTWWRKRQGRGGGVEYHLSALPRAAQLKLAFDATVPEALEAVPATAGEARRAELWRQYDRATDKRKAVAKRRLEALQAWDTLIQHGSPQTLVGMQVAREFDCSFSTLREWRSATERLDRCDWLPALLPHQGGGRPKAEMDERAWQVFLADWLRLEAPTLRACYERTADVARAEGWVWPPECTVARRAKALPDARVVLARQGTEALKRLYPAQQRDRSMFHALEAVNLDGHRWDVFVRWPDGRIARPQMLAIQDLYSGRILSWRVDETLHRGLVQLAFGDMITAFGVPSHCYMDNGRENASKWISGRVPNRYRFAVRDEDPAGLLPQLGVQVHWTTPYSGQSKPIERAFRDLAGQSAKHPAFAGAYTGNSPDAKPENYGSTAVPLAEFLRVVGDEIVRHNARVGRRSAVCGGTLSFDQAFLASYGKAEIRKATEDQRRLCLLAAEAVTSDRRDGAVSIAGNRYWCEDLTAVRGTRVVVRFDPTALHGEVHVSRLDGSFVATAACVAAAGFADQDAAREHGRARRKWMRAQKDALEAERRLSLQDLTALHAKQQVAAPDPEEPKVVRPLFGLAGATALQVRPEDDEEEISEGDRRLVEFARRARGDRLRVVEGGDD